MGPMVTGAHRGVVASFLEKGWAPPGVRSRPTRPVPCPMDPGSGSADRGGPGRAELAHGPRGDLRPDRCRHPIRRRGRRGTPGQRHPVWPVGSIWTRDGARSLRVARAVQAGNLSVNFEQLGPGADQLRRHEAVRFGRSWASRPSPPTARSRTSSCRRPSDVSGSPHRFALREFGGGGHRASRGIGAGMAGHFAQRGSDSVCAPGRSRSHLLGPMPMWLPSTSRTPPPSTDSPMRSWPGWAGSTYG